MSWLDSDDFPSGPGGISVDQYSPWVHPVTQTVYFWEPQKMSWVTLNSPGARIFSDTEDPAISNGITLQDGDLWWDSRHLELRVYHRPLPLTSDGYVAGRWVSSTNPEMSPEDPNRNMIIGTIMIDGPSAPYEVEEVTYTVTRPFGGAPESKIDYEWRSSPPEVVIRDDDGNDLTITPYIDTPHQSSTNIVFPQGSAIFDGNYQVSFNISCKITAKPEFEDEFVNTIGNSPSINVKPIPLTADPVQYIVATVGASGSIIHNNGSVNVIGTDTVTSTFLVPNFFISTTNSLLTDMKYSTKPKGESSQNDIVSTKVSDYGPISDGNNGTVQNKNGYLLQISTLNLASDVTLYIWDEANEALTGTLILQAS